MIGGSQQNVAAWTSPGRPRRRPGRVVYWVLVAISAALAVAGFGIAAATFRQFTDPATSMEKTVAPGDHLMVSLGQDVRRGDIVVMHDPKGPGLLAKRVIGLPGDHVTCCDAQGRVRVNGKPLDETYIPPGVPPSKIKFSVTLGLGQIWVMGDDRTISLDSREYGPVRASAIAGYAFAKVSGVTATSIRTPQTYVADGLAPPDHRVPPFAWAAVLATAGVLALIVLAIVGIVRSAIRRSRARKPPPGHTGYGPYGAAGPYAGAGPYGSAGDAGPGA